MLDCFGFKLSITRITIQTIVSEYQRCTATRAFITLNCIHFLPSLFKNIIHYIYILPHIKQKVTMIFEKICDFAHFFQKSDDFFFFIAILKFCISKLSAHQRTKRTEDITNTAILIFCRRPIFSLKQIRPIKAENTIVPPDITGNWIVAGKSVEHTS